LDRQGPRLSYGAAGFEAWYILKAKFVIVMRIASVKDPVFLRRAYPDKGRHVRATIVGIAVLLFVSLALRLYHLDYFSLWLDELTQYFHSARPVADLIQNSPDEMFLSYLFGHLCIRLHLDGSPWLLRLPAALFGVGTVVCTWLLARECWDERMAWITGVLVTVWPTLIVYSQEYRTYSMFTMLAVLSCYFLVLALRTNLPLHWVLFSLFTLLDLFNHFAALFTLVSLLLFTVSSFGIDVAKVWHSRSRVTCALKHIQPRASWAALSYAIVGVGYLPASLFLARFLSHPEIVPDRARLPISLESVRALFGRLLGVGEGWQLLLISIIALVGLVCAWWHRPRTALLITFWILVPLAVSALRPGGATVMTSARFLLFIVPLYLLLMAVGTLVFADRAAAWLYSLYRTTTGSWGSKRSQPILPSAPPRTWLFATLMVAATVLALVILPGLLSTYSLNPKPLPMNGRDAYDYALRQVGPQDLLLEVTSATGGHVHWYAFYESYFLRPAVRPSGLSVAFVDQTLFPPNETAMANLKGRLYAIFMIDPSEEGALRQAAGDYFTVTCFTRMCTLMATDRAAGAMSNQIHTFFKRFLPLNPPDFTPGLQASQQDLLRRCEDAAQREREPALQCPVE